MADRPARTSEQRKALVARAWRLRVEGKSQAAIALELGVSQGQVSRWLARAGRRVAKEMAEEMKLYFLLTLEQTELLIHEAFEGFERSTRPSRRTVRKAGETTVEVKERVGDPEWLSQVHQTIRLQLELFALVLPKLVRTKGAKDGPSATQEYVTVASALLAAERRDAAERSRDLSESDTPPDRPSLESD